MALSLLSQHQQQPNYFDLQTLFDPYPLQQHQQQQPQYPHNYYQQQDLQHQQQQQYNNQLHIQQQLHLQHLSAHKNSGINDSTLKTDPTTEPISFCSDQMEYATSNLQQNHYQQQQSRNSNENINNTNINSNSSIGNSNNRKTSNITHNSNNSQILNKTNRYYVNGYSQHQVASDYVITFVDSPPNSEESWTDENTKESPGPQIIDVQTIYSNSGSRKRRMDWDSLDIGQSGNTATTQSGGLASKIPHHDKDKVKKDKTTVLKQEPQADQLKANKCPLNTHPVVTGSGGSVPKLDKPPSHIETAPTIEDTPKNALNDILCVCGSPKTGTPQEIEHNGNKIDKSNAGASNAFGNVGSPYSGGEKIIAQGNSASQQLTEVDGSKIENSTGGGAANGNNTNAHSDDHKFQYILAAATSIATKNNEETLTYLNQGQSYEIKLKKIGDLSFYRDKILKSVIKICFHERRLQFMEREQMQQWQASRPGERIIEVDVPLSYGLCHVSQPLNPNFLNTVEIFWDPLKEVGVYVKVNCISTEFTPKKHGGEKGVPFRLQIETYIESTNPTGGTTASAISAGALSIASTSVSGGIASAPIPAGINIPSGNNHSLVNGKQPVHAAACQIKVFKLKGADRKHKQDREKIQRRPQVEQNKFQPSYECTIMNDIPLDVLPPTTSGCFSPEYMKIWPNSPVHLPKYDGILPYTGGSAVTNSSPIAINSVTSTNSPTLKLMEANMVSPQQSVTPDMDDYAINILPESSPSQVAQWLSHHRLTSYLSTFAHFSGSDIMRMSKEDLVQICGLADGIRMFNILRAKTIAPRLTLYVSLDGNSYNAIYLLSNTSKELMQKLCKLPGFYEMIANGNTNGPLENGSIYSSWSMHSKYSGSGSNIFNDSTKNFIFLAGPSGVHVNVTDEVLNNEVRDGSLYALEVQNGKVVMKLINKNDN
ncbi:protein grainyhead isoform X2 [Bactrocera oleae]|uniref:protein grainyhead isoform X2 n=1 Tax=Bactrocera oleae TaxID=104688 RepID=UPI00387E8742